jgi:hypothetical protein
VQDFLGDVALAADRVDGDDGAFDRQQFEQLGDGDDLVRLVRHLDLTEHQALMRCERRDHVDRRLGVLLPAGAAQRLAVDGDDLPRRAGQRRHPLHKAALELLGFEGGDDVAEVIVRGRSVAKRPEPAQQFDLLLAEACDINESLRSRQHRQ